MFVDSRFIIRMRYLKAQVRKQIYYDTGKSLLYYNAQAHSYYKCPYAYVILYLLQPCLPSEKLLSRRTLLLLYCVWGPEVDRVCSFHKTRTVDFNNIRLYRNPRSAVRSYIKYIILCTIDGG